MAIADALDQLLKGQQRMEARLAKHEAMLETLCAPLRAAPAEGETAPAPTSNQSSLTLDNVLGSSYVIHGNAAAWTAEAPEPSLAQARTEACAEETFFPAAARMQLEDLSMTTSLQVPAHMEGIWFSALSGALELAHLAACIVDMQVPGIPMAFCNSAFETVTGYSPQEATGKNCRFLQGADSEPAAVAEMIRAVRNAEDAVIHVTNYRKDGTRFTNELSLTPVLDSNDAYRYSIGVISALEGRCAAEERAVGALRELLPRRMPAVFEDAPEAGDMEEAASAKLLQYQTSMIKFTKLLWALDTEASFAKLMRTHDAREAFSAYLHGEDLAKLEFYLDFQALMDSDESGAAALYARFRGGEAVAAPNVDMETTRAEVRETYAFLASGPFPRFIKSKACEEAIGNLLGSIDSMAERAKNLMWDQYLVPSDVEGFLYSFVAVAESFPACIVLSDMSIAGNPMFFVNQEFVRTTGYSKEESHGRNCRFLQGPLTEPESVVVIQDTLRRGVDCFVRITNYRRDGTNFQNLLSMRPVHDSNGEYRFCIGVQFEVDKGADIKKRLKKLALLLQLLPSEVEVPRAIGSRAVHERVLTESEAAMTEEDRLLLALGGNALPSTDGASDVVHRGCESFADNHDTMLNELRAGTNPTGFKARAGRHERRVRLHG